MGGLQNAFLYDTVFCVKITGQIVHGAGRGRGLGFPTLNIDAAPEGLDFGIYAAWVTLEDGRFKGAMSYGSRLTFSEDETVLEVYVLDFSGNEYGEKATVEVVKKLRAIQRFDSADLLKAQIAADVEEVRALLADA